MEQKWDNVNRKFELIPFNDNNNDAYWLEQRLEMIDECEDWQKEHKKSCVVTMAVISRSTLGLSRGIKQSTGLLLKHCKHLMSFLTS